MYMLTMTKFFDRCRLALKCDERNEDGQDEPGKHDQLARGAEQKTNENVAPDRVEMRLHDGGKTRRPNRHKQASEWVF
jgi:hypothetical protein